MILILWLRAGMSGAPSLYYGLSVLAGKRDVHQKLCSLALRDKTDGSAQHCGSLSHALNAEAV
jgi:hypothetical protein